MAYETKKIEDRINFYLWTAPKLELFILPAFIKTDKPFVTSLQQYLEECPYHKLIYTEFLINDPTVMTADEDTYSKVRKLCVQNISEVTSGCRFVLRFPNNLSLEENITFSRVWRDLFVGFCIDFETFQQSNGHSTKELRAAGAQIAAIVLKCQQLTQLSNANFPILPTNRILLQDFTEVSEQELEHTFSEIIPSHYQLILSVKPNEIGVVGKKLHLLFSREICFYLSRASTDSEPALSDLIRTLPIKLDEASRLVHNGYQIAALSVYEESYFLEMLHLTDMRYAVNTPPKRVAIFGRRDTEPGDIAYETAHKIGIGLASKGFQVITGGYVGIMGAANSGAILAERKESATKPLSEGVLCPSLFIRRIKGHQDLSKRYVTYGINQRTNKMVEHSSVLLVMPGTVGTFTELLVGLGMSNIDSLFSLPGYPRVIIACRDPWESIIKSCWKLMNAPDSQIREFIEYFDTAEEAIELVEKKYQLLVKLTQY